jgi:hypothetical protein
MVAALAVIYLQTNLTIRRQSNALSYNNIDIKQSNVLQARTVATHPDCLSKKKNPCLKLLGCAVFRSTMGQSFF